MRNDALYNETSVVIAASGNDSEAINFQPFAQGGFLLPATFQGTAVSFKVSLDGGTTFIALYDSANSLVSITVTQNRAYAFPIALFAFGLVKIVSNNGGGEAAARTIRVALKY